MLIINTFMIGLMVEGVVIGFSDIYSTANNRNSSDYGTDSIFLKKTTKSVKWFAI